MGSGAFPTKSKAVILTSYTILLEVGKVYVDSKLYVVRPVRSRVKITVQGLYQKDLFLP